MLSAIASGVEDIAQLLGSGQTSGEVGTVNSFGDKQLEVGPSVRTVIVPLHAPSYAEQSRGRHIAQTLDPGVTLQVDIAADDIIFNRLKQSCAVATASSEERPKEITVGGQGYAVAFDPLDGSSIVGANFSVGAIFGVWKGDKLLGRTGEEQAAAAYAVFGSRTSLIVALPDPGAKTSFPLAQEVPRASLLSVALPSKPLEGATILLLLCSLQGQQLERQFRNTH